MNLKTAIKVVQRRISHLQNRLDKGTDKNSEQALMFDAREKEALEFLIREVSPPPMAEETEDSKKIEAS